jgi:NitT/TauT family transport system substrate-binding protein
LSILYFLHKNKEGKAKGADYDTEHFLAKWINQSPFQLSLFFCCKNNRLLILGDLYFLYQGDLYMNRMICISMFCVLFTLPLLASGKNDIPQPTLAVKPAIVNVSAIQGPSAVPMAYLFENHPQLGGVESNFEVSASPDILLPRMIKGEIDIGILPINIAAKVYNTNNGMILLAAIVNEGMVNLVTKDEAINSFVSLKGKRLYVAGQGATPDYLTRYLLSVNGISVGEGDEAVTLDFSIPTAEIAPALISGRIDYAVVPEPFATVITSNNPIFRRAIDYQKEFAIAQNDPAAVYPVASLVVRAEFARHYPETLKLFLNAMENAIVWTNANPSEAGVLVQKHTLGLQPSIVTRSIPTSAFVYSSAEKARPSVERLLRIFLQHDQSSVGGKIPDDGFYFK